MKSKVQMLLPALLGAAGFLLRYLQQGVFDPETGLAERGAPVSYAMAAYLVLIAVCFLLAALRSKKQSPMDMDTAFRPLNQSMLMPVVCVSLSMLTFTV